MTGEVQPQDKDSGLVERSWVRRSKRRGELTERTLEGEPVKVEFMDPQGHVQHASGIVQRSEAGELVVVESLAGGGRKETAVTRDANVERLSR